MKTLFTIEKKVFSFDLILKMNIEKKPFFDLGVRVQREKNRENLRKKKWKRAEMKRLREKKRAKKKKI